MNAIVEPQTQESATNLSLSSIVIREGHNPRKTRSKKQHALLTESIRSKGILQSVLVRPHPTEPGMYELVAGETRYTIANEIELTTIPATIRQIDDADLTEYAMTENVSRFSMTPMDEGDAAKKMLSEGHSKDDICLIMGWKMQRLEGRIQLTHCTDTVRQAMVDENITIGHAQLLSGLREQAQESALKVIIGKQLTVDGFRDLLESLSFKLASAPFDTADCAACPHNSATQATLFDASSSGGKCLNKTCFTEKSEAHMQTVKADLAETYNKIELSSEVAQHTTAIVVAGGTTGVGQEQLNACAGCENYGAIIDTALGSRAQVKGSQCFDLTCHKEKVSSYQSIIATDAPSDTDTTTGATNHNVSGTSQGQTASTTAKTPAKAKAKAAKPATPSIIADRHHGIHRAAAANHLKNTNDLKTSQIILLLSMMAEAQIKPSTAPEGWPTSLHIGKDRTNAAIILNGMSAEELNSLQMEVATKALHQSYKTTATDRGDVFGAVAEWYSSTQEADLAKHFMLDETYLKPFTKPVIGQLLEASGFAEDYNTKADDKKAFKALMNYS